MTDLEIEIECCSCGLFYRQGMSEMSHGVALRCPFCSSTSLDVGAAVPAEVRFDEQKAGISMDRHAAERKVKF